MAKNKLPIVKRVEIKTLKMVESKHSISEIAQYISHALRSFKDKRKEIISMVEAINPLIALKAEMLDRTINEKKAVKNKLESQRIKESELIRKSAEECRLENLRNEYLNAQDEGREIRWGVSLLPTDRKNFFNAKEIKEIIALRREKLSTYKARTLLACTLTEINRWDEEGLLPHAFKQVIQVGGKATESRFWLESEVLAKKAEIEDWRKSHELKKSFKRKRNPLVKWVG